MDNTRPGCDEAIERAQRLRKGMRDGAAKMTNPAARKRVNDAREGTLRSLTKS